MTFLSEYLMFFNDRFFTKSNCFLLLIYFHLLLFVLFSSLVSYAEESDAEQDLYNCSQKHKDESTSPKSSDLKFMKEKKENEAKCVMLLKDTSAVQNYYFVVATCCYEFFTIKCECFTENTEKLECIADLWPILTSDCKYAWKKFVPFKVREILNRDKQMIREFENNDKMLN